VQLGFAKAHHQISPEEKWVWPWTRGASQYLGFPFNITAKAGASDFKFYMPLGFAKGNHKITPMRGPGLGELPKIWGFPFNISATAEASDFKFGTQLGFAKAHHKITRRGKVGVVLY